MMCWTVIGRPAARQHVIRRSPHRFLRRRHHAAAACRARCDMRFNWPLRESSVRLLGDNRRRRRPVRCPLTPPRLQQVTVAALPRAEAPPAAVTPLEKFATLVTSHSQLPRKLR